MAHESDFARCASLHEGDLQIGDASSKTESQGSSTSDPVSVHLTPETDLTLVILGNLLDVYSASLKSVDLEAAEHIFHQEFPDSEWTLDGRVETVNGFLNIGTPFAAECVLLLALEHRIELPKRQALNRNIIVVVRKLLIGVANCEPCLTKS